MNKRLNWKEQMQWELYKIYISSGDSLLYECYNQSKLATEQFINNLAADAREELEESGLQEENFEAIKESYADQWTSQRNSDCFNAVERAFSGKPLPKAEGD